MSAHPGGFDVRFWFDTTDNLWHGSVAGQPYADATLEGLLKQAQAVFPALNQSGFVNDACWAIGISDKS